MALDAISGYLYSQSLQNIKGTTTAKTQETTGNTDSADFAKLLTKEISGYSEMQSMATVLDKSVLGSLSQNMDISALSEDLLSTGSGRKVIAELAEGHLNSIVMSDGSDSDDTGISNVMDTYTETVNETTSLEEILDKLSEIAANGGSNKE